MASRNLLPLSSIPITAEERRFRETFKADLQRNEGILSRPLSCTVCNINIKHRLVTSRNEHVLIGVLLCNLCSHRIRLTVSKHQNENNKNFCHWCANEDACKILINCENCTRKFCRMCTTKHYRYGKRMYTPWMCFACSPNQWWYNLRALCAESIRYAEEMKKDLETRRKRTATSMPSTAIRGNILPELYLSPRVSTTNFSTMTTGGQSNISVTVTVSTSPMMEARVSEIVHRSASQNALNLSSPAAIRGDTSASRNGSHTTMEQDDKCVICMDGKPQYACYPCGHLCLCETCSFTFERKFKRCPMCRDFYEKVLKIYRLV